MGRFFGDRFAECRCNGYLDHPFKKDGLGLLDPCAGYFLRKLPEKYDNA
jgi:hypothetical protein